MQILMLPRELAGLVGYIVVGRVYHLCVFDSDA